MNNHFANGMPIEWCVLVSLLPDVNAGLWITLAAGALLAGFSASGHCALMCGPLAYAGLGRKPLSKWRAAFAWNAGRLLAYTIVGALLGFAGQRLAWSLSSVARVLPLVMAAGFVVAAFDLSKRLRMPRALAQVAHAVMRWGARFSPLYSRAIAGAATPFLPCGVLWGGYMAAVGSGSFGLGATVMGAFALGGMPALTAVQTQWGMIARWPRAELWLRRGAPLLAAAFLVWRALNAPSGAPPSCH